MKQKYEGAELITEKMKALHAKLTEKAQAATNSYSAKRRFFTTYLFCAYG